MTEDTWHVYPVHDIMTHVTDSGEQIYSECPCNPEWELQQQQDGTLSLLVLHNEMRNDEG